MDLKTTQSHAIVAMTAASAAGFAAVPIPFPDAFILVPLQVTMLASISFTFGLRIDERFRSTIIGSIITGAGGTLTGRAIVASILQMIPGVGSAINAYTAAALTTAFGEAYIAALQLTFTTNNGEPPTSEEVVEAFTMRYLQLTEQRQ